MLLIFLILFIYVHHKPEKMGFVTSAEVAKLTVNLNMLDIVTCIAVSIYH